MGPAPEGNPPRGDDMSSQFDKSISMVQSVTARLEQDYVRPGLQTYQQFFARRPLTATFVAIFSVLSVFPVITFIGLSFSISALFIVVALAAALCVSGTVVLALFLALFGVLIATFFTALFLTAATISSFSFVRLVILLREQGYTGAYIWVFETKDSLLNLMGKGSNQSTTPKFDNVTLEMTSNTGMEEKSF